MGARSPSWSRLSELPVPSAPPPASPARPPLSPIDEVEAPKGIDIGAEGFFVFFSLLALVLILWSWIDQRPAPAPPPPVAGTELTSL